jgi:cyclopropane fatty-acyl-phospholipid synthase-like methyltransferase
VTRATDFREGYHGTGPGAFTPDGCAVELYLRVPAGPEPDLVQAAVPAGAHLLELGCGVGRLTRPLVERGFTVTAVDESPDMLRHVTDARTVLSSIEVLELGETFDVVLLASHLVNTTDRATCAAILDTCRRHVRDDGCVLIQREPDGRYDQPVRQITWPTGERLTFTVSPTDDENVLSVVLEYAFPDVTWTQTYRTRLVPRAAFEAELAAAGLVVDAYLTEDESWVRARTTR